MELEELFYYLYMEEQERKEKSGNEVQEEKNATDNTPIGKIKKF